ncbi:MAG: DNA polymerase [Phycisphaeraceae bacterium]|nr:MAG: DNA polymerase [Phycisphaeraceae bacterium]
MLQWLYVDMNAFFASVEQALHPELRGLPVAVVPLIAETTSVIAASYQAKAFGVKTGTKVADARRLCPGLRLVLGSHGAYTRFHHTVAAAIDTVIPVDRVCSIDEFRSRLAPNQRTPALAARLAADIKRAIASRCGPSLTCSIGVAPNPFIAKVAADMLKPDGLTIIEKHELPGRLFPLPMTDLPGIGPRMDARLRRLGITSIERLASMSRAQLRHAWGSVVGEEWYDRLRGDTLHDAPTVRRSVGHSHVLPPDKRPHGQARPVAVRLLAKAAQRVRHLGYVASSITLSVRYLGDASRRARPGVHGVGWGGAFARWHEEASLPGVSDTPTLLAALAGLWDRAPVADILALGVTLAGLEPADAATGSLFGGQRARSRLAAALDAITGRYGADAVYPASMHDAKKSAPRRIAFSNIPDLDLPDIDTATGEAEPTR